MKTIKHYAGVTFFEIRDQVYELRDVWNLYCQIFCVKHEEPLPFSIAPKFFYFIYRSFQEHCVGIIVRLFDRPSERNSDGDVYGFNISFYYLIDQLIEEGYPGIEIASLKKQVDRFKMQFKGSIFKFRNKRYAHNDYDTIRKNDYNPMREDLFTVPELISAVELIFNITNSFEDLLLQKMKISKNEQDFYANPKKTDFSLITTADADIVIEVIKKALS